MPGATPDPASWLTAEWETRFAGALEMMTEARPGLSCGSPLAPSAPEIPAGAIWYSTRFDLGAGMAILAGASEENWRAIGNSALLAAGVTDISAEDARGACFEIVTQAASGLAQDLTAKLGKPVASLAPSQAGAGDAACVFPIDITFREPPVIRVYLGLSAALLQSISPGRPEGERAESGPQSETGQHAEPGHSRNLDLLMEVELPVSVSFGRAELPLRDVLKLNSGSIVELNRTITDLVEIVVNNCVIARGEVVVIEGNYGVRIHEVVSREERLRTLK